MRFLDKAKVVAVLLVALATTSGAAFGEGNWPTWRGPTANGLVPTGDPPITWSESLNVKWKVPVPGSGSSTPAVWGDKIFLSTAVAQGEGAGAAYKFNVVCLDRGTGKVLWERTAREAVPHEAHHPTGSHASYSPITDGKYVWASFGSRGLHCYDLEGNHQWSRDLIEMTMFRRFGEGSSPALAGDAIIVVMDHEGDSKIFAFNKVTGELLWERDRDEGTSWSTPYVVEEGGAMRAIVSATNLVRSYDVKTGDVVWQCEGLGRSVIPMPVVGFGNVYCMNGFRTPGMMAIALGGTGDLSDTDSVVWQTRKYTPDVASPLLYGDKLYVLARVNPVLSCYNPKTGEPIFEGMKLEGLRQVYASPIGVAGRIYIAGREGAVAVVKQSNNFEVLATNVLDDRFDASPVVIGDELYLKGKTNLYCIAKP